MAPLDAWHDFYVIVGSSAGALIGLQFVIITLIASLPGPEFEDWLCHAALPFLAYATLLGSSLFFLGPRPLRVLFVGAAAALLLLFVGIHSAWAAITYHVFFSRKRLLREDRTGQTSHTAPP